jgi:hypothetical protein
MALDLDAAIRAKIEAGVLAPTPQAVDYVTGGCAEPCHACDERILSIEMEYGVKIASGRVLRLHLRCYRAWIDACAVSTVSTMPRSVSSEPNSR